MTPPVSPRRLSPRRQSTGVMQRAFPRRHDSNPMSASGPISPRRRASSSLGVGSVAVDPVATDSSSGSRNRSNSPSYIKADISSTAAKVESVDVIVNVLRGEDLAAKDRNWKGEAISSDPYCIVKLLVLSSSGPAATQEVELGKTETVTRSLNPVWKERMEVTIGHLNANSKYALQFTILDEDEMTKDDLMGVVTIPLDTTRPVNVTKWYDIPADSANKATGRVQLALQTKLRYNDGRMAVAEAPKPKQKQSPERSVKKDVAFLDIDLMVHQGDGLVAKDRNIVGTRTTSDPFVEVTLLPDGISGCKELSLGLTKTVERSLSPVWQDQFFTRVPVSTLSDNAQLRLTIKDHDDFTADDLMGVVHIHLPLVESCRASKWYAVPASSASNASGRIQCSLVTQRSAINGLESNWAASNDAKETEEPATITTTTTTRPANADGPRNDTIDSITVAVTLLAGAGLAAKDRNLVGKRNSSDPYVKVALLTTPPGASNEGKEIDMGTTQIVPRSLAPVWNERFEKTLYGVDMVRINEARLQFTVYDRDLAKQDDCMGVLTIPVPLVNTTPATSVARWYGIPSHSAKNASGRLLVQLETTVVYASNRLRRSELAATTSANSAQPGMSRKSSVRNLQAIARSRDSSAFCTPRRNIHTQRHYKAQGPAPVLVRVFNLDDSTRDLNNSISQLSQGKGMSRDASKSTTQPPTLRQGSLPPTPSAKCLETSKVASKPLTTQTHRRASSPPAPRNWSISTFGPSSDAANVGGSTYMGGLSMSVHGGTDATAAPSGRIKAGDLTQSKSGLKSRFAPHQKARSRDSSAFCTPRRTRAKESVSEIPVKSSSAMAKLKSIATPMSPEGVKKIKRSTSKSSTKANASAKASPTKSSTEENSWADASPSSIYCTPRRKGPSLKVKTIPTPNVMSIRLSSDDSPSTTAPLNLPETKETKATPESTNNSEAPATGPVVPVPCLSSEAAKTVTFEASTQTANISNLHCRRSPKTTWTCNCGFESAKTHPFCGMCGTRQFWICGDCEFDSNICLYKFCGMCGIPRNEKPSTNKSNSSKVTNQSNTSPVSVRAF